MNLGIAGKVALVTGGSRGLGRAAAQALAEEGCRIVILARDASRLEAAVADLRASGLDAHGIAADVSAKDELGAAFDRIRVEHGDPDILVYNNGGARDHDFEHASDEDFWDAYSVLVMGFVWCARAVLPGMRERGWGRIVTLGSLCAREPHKEHPLVLHNLGRPAQVGLSKTLSNEVARDGVTVNTIATGTIDHDGDSVRRAYAAGAAARGLSDDEVDRFRSASVPVGRTGRPEELGALCAFLCSDRAGYINGQTILLDGGRVASLM